MSAQMEIRIANRIPEIEQVCEKIEDFGKSIGLDQKFIFALHLALDEILTNIISYGYDDKKTHEIIVNLAIDKGSLVMEIEDDAHPFNPDQAPQPDLDTPLQQRKIGGLGIYLVKNLMDSLHYESSHGKNKLTLMKQIKKDDASN